jgi:hypothetical protein
MKKSAKVWKFVQCRTGSRETWAWERSCADDGTVEEMSPLHGSFGKAVADALDHGFQPRRESWETRAGDWITRFTPGKSPLSMREVPLPGLPAVGRKKVSRNRIHPDALPARRAKPLPSAGGNPAPARKSWSRRP